MRINLFRIVNPDREERKSQAANFDFKVGATLGLLGALVVLGIIEFFAPSLWDYPFSASFSAHLADVLRYWPLLLWGLALSALGSACREDRTTGHDHRHFLVNSALGAYAGVWEEIGYRCVFAAFAFFGAAVSGAIWWILALALLAALALVITGGLADRFSSRSDKFWLAGALALTGLLVWGLWAMGNPAFFVYDWVLAPIYSFLTLGYLDPLLYNPELRYAAIGLTFANAWFREGHTYQGPVGVMNSWFAGFVLIHAATTYGLWTAVAVHAIYNVGVNLSVYVTRRLHARRLSRRS